jgi:RNA polymerase sigma factor (sigma-70 family)
MTEALAFLQHIRGLAGEAANEDDRRLVERFASAREQAAFVALVRRHGPMVFGVCRRALNNLQDAEDAFQATFLVLARKAHSLRNHACVASWLCRVAHHAALRARARDACRGERERAAARPEAVEAGAFDEQETWQALHEEMHRLPERYHAPLALCYLQGRTYEEAARQLRWPLGTLKKRLTQARQLLRERLARRGLGLAAALPALPLAGEAACPDALLRAPFGGRPAAGALAEEVIRAMSTTRLKVRAVLALALVVLAVGAGLVARPEPPAARPVPADKGPRPAPAGPALPRRVLLAGSAPTRELQFLRTLLQREEDKRRVRLTTYSQTDRRKGVPGALSRFPDLLRPPAYPRTKEEQKPYNLNEYDLIVAFDLDWARPGPEALVLLESWVARGGGLVLVAGPLHTPALAAADAQTQGLGPLLEMCPVVPVAAPRKGAPSQPRRLRFVKGAPDLPFLRLDPAGKGPHAGWEDFYTGDGGPKGDVQRGFYTCHPAKVRKGARALLMFAGPKEEAPYLAVRPHGKGRVVWLGSGETWRLRQYRESYYERFWLELARYAAPGKPGPS